MLFIKAVSELYTEMNAGGGLKMNILNFALLANLNA